MLLKPRPGCQYRRTDTKQLIDPEKGDEFDPTDLVVARHLARGELVPVNPPRASRGAGRSKG